MEFTSNDIKQIFFQCSHKDPNGFYANEVDIIEFAKKILEFDKSRRQPMTQDEILDFMVSTNLTANGDTLLDRLTTLVKAVEKFHGIT